MVSDKEDRNTEILDALREKCHIWEEYQADPSPDTLRRWYKVVEWYNEITS